MVKNKGDKIMTNIDLMLLNKKWDKEKEEEELRQSQEKILESYNMIVKELCLKEWDTLKKIVDWAFEKERIEKEKKLMITSKDLIDLIDYEQLNSRM